MHSDSFSESLNLHRELDVLQNVCSCSRESQHKMSNHHNIFAINLQIIVCTRVYVYHV